MGADTMKKVAALVAVGTLVLVLSGCGGGDPPLMVTPSGGPASPTAVPSDLTITPEPDTSDAPLSTEIGTLLTDGEVTGVVLSTAAGGRLSGQMRDDGTAWVPDHPLEPATTYTATVTAAGSGDRVTTAQTTFTTMSAPDRRTDTGLYLFDDRVYGVAMPVVVEFVQAVPEEFRAGVQRRMFVTTDPPQPGVWHWVGDGRQAFYRGRDYWRPGTTLSVRIALDGHPTGDGRYGDTDRRATVTIGDKTEIKVDNASKQMSVLVNDELVRELPVSLGKPSTPSSSGTMVVMSKERQTVFDTYDELGPEEGYRLDIEYAMRLTWGGEFIHAAPWSVADHGVRNVSHGCVNLSMSNAEWLFGLTKIGDPVTVTGTERGLADGNGWTAWDLTWDEFIAGSALPVGE
jgi:lipoprotein-anchoring transpeptidase ErfK/SrfK